MHMESSPPPQEGWPNFLKMPISMNICDIRKNLEKLNNLVLEEDNNETIRNKVRIPEGM